METTMKPRFKALLKNGRESSVNVSMWPQRGSIVTVRMEFVACVGDYDVWKYTDYNCFLVARDPETTKLSVANFTHYELEGGNLHPHDNDVQPDPYHMCLIYQAVQDFNKTKA